MNLISAFNKNLNTSYDSEKHYTSWAEHRYEISQILSKISLDHKDVLIIGVGNCNDINLELFTQCRRVVLLDIDIESMALGVKRQGFENKFELLQFDVTGLGETEFINAYINALQSDSTKEVLQLYENEPLVFDIGPFDHIIILPIYTQLLLPQLLPLLNKEEHIHELLNFIGTRIQVFNQTVRNNLHLSGTVTIFSDVLEYETTSEEGQYLLVHKNHTMILEQHFNDYLQMYGHGLGSYGLLEMASYLKIKSEDYLIWPFDDNRLLLVKVEKYG